MPDQLEGGLIVVALTAIVWLSKALYESTKRNSGKRSLPPPATTPKEPLAGAALIERNATAHEKANQLLERLCDLGDKQLAEITATRHKLGDGLQRVHEAVGQDISASEERTERRLEGLRQDLREIRQRMPSVAGGE